MSRTAPSLPRSSVSRPFSFCAVTLNRGVPATGRCVIRPHLNETKVLARAAADGTFCGNSVEKFGAAIEQ